MKLNDDGGNPFCGPLQMRGGRLFQRRGMVIRDLGPARGAEFDDGDEADHADELKPRAPIDLSLARFLRELRRDLEMR
jgi:hypothetical protein